MARRLERKIRRARTSGHRDWDFSSGSVLNRSQLAKQSAFLSRDRQGDFLSRFRQSALSIGASRRRFENSSVVSQIEHQLHVKKIQTLVEFDRHFDEMCDASKTKAFLQRDTGRLIGADTSNDRMEANLAGSIDQVAENQPAKTASMKVVTDIDRRF